MDPPGHDELRRLVEPRLHAPPGRRARGPDARAVRALPRPATRRRRLRLRRGLRREDPGDAHRRAARRAERGPGPAPHLGRPADALRAGRHQRREGRTRSPASSAYMSAMVEDRRQHPRDDMVSDLLAAELTRDDGTQRRLDGRRGDGVLLAAAARGERDHRAPARAGRRCCSRAIPTSGPSSSRRRSSCPTRSRNCLRYEAPSPIQARFVTRDVEWHGQKVPQYSKIAMLTGQRGTRRARVPRRRPLRRRAPLRPPRDVRVRHPLLPGRQPGRLEGRIVLEETLARFPEWGVDEAAVEMVRTSTVRGPVHVPITI